MAIGNFKIVFSRTNEPISNRLTLKHPLGDRDLVKPIMIIHFPNGDNLFGFTIIMCLMI